MQGRSDGVKTADFRLALMTVATALSWGSSNGNADYRTGVPK